MPELPEVETVRRLVTAALRGKRIITAELPYDAIVQKNTPDGQIEEALTGAIVTHVGRRGKYWWIELDRKPWLFAHLGMTGWVRDLSKESIRLKDHGSAPWNDAVGRPRFLKMLLTADDGSQIAMTDGRRLSRLWLAESPEANSNICALGRDVYETPWQAAELYEALRKRSAPMKALLMDQSIFCGIGNWTADEVLYRSGISPLRQGIEMDLARTARLVKELAYVLEIAVGLGADSDQFPEDWLFHFRWGGKKGPPTIGGNLIKRDSIGGRTTAWVPGVQK